MVRPGLLVTELPLKPVLLLKGAHRFSFSIAVRISIQNFKEISFEEINPRIEMQQTTREAFTDTFSQVLTVFWPGSAFHKSSCSRQLHTVLSVRTARVGGHRLRVGVRSAHWGCAGLCGGCGESRVHPRARESNLQEDFVDRPLFFNLHLMRENTGCGPVVFPVLA